MSDPSRSSSSRLSELFLSQRLLAARHGLSSIGLHGGGHAGYLGVETRVTGDESHTMYSDFFFFFFFYFGYLTRYYPFFFFFFLNDFKPICRGFFFW